MTHGVTIDGEYTGIYEKCKNCHLFIGENPSYGDTEGLARWVHLHRGDNPDETLDETHQAEPSGLIATIEVWKKFGPPAMRARFLPSTFDVVHHDAPDYIGSLLVGGVPWDDIDPTLMGVTP